MMKTDVSNKIYSEVFDFYDKKGLIVQLVRMFQISESERYSKLNVDKEGLSLLETVRCLFDRNRSILFAREVENICTPDSVVIEAGVGTGILSFVAAACGAQVYGVEINKKAFELVNELKTELVSKGYFKSDRIQFTLGDVRTYDPNVSANLIISENNYTGMFYEKQISIGNHLVKFLKPKGVAVSSGWQDFAFLAQSEFPHTPEINELFVPMALEGVWIPYKQLSPTMQYTNFDFQKTNSEIISFNNIFTAPEDGEINSLVVYSLVPMPSGYVIGRYDCIALNNDIVIAIPAIKVKKGERLELNLEYNCGDDVEKAKITVTKNRS